MALIGFLVVIRRWSRCETRRETRDLRMTAQIGNAPPRDSASIATSTGIRRQALALGLLSAGIAAIFAARIGVAIPGAA